MPLPDFQDYAPIFPEICLAVAAMVLLMYGVFSDSDDTEIPGWFAILILVGTCALIILQTPGTQVLFGGAFIVDDFARFVKILILAGSAFSLILSFDYLRSTRLL